MSAPKVSFHVALAQEPLDLLNVRSRLERRREQEWVAARRRELIPPGLPRREVAKRRRSVRAEVAAKRASGEFGGSRDDLVSRAVREELRARGLDRDWPEPPAGELDAPGRRWGTPPSLPLGSGGYPARLSVKLPADLAETLRRAAYWASAEAVAGLQEWADQWGEGGEVAAREAHRDGLPAELGHVVAAGRPSAPQAALQIRDRLRAQVVTTGDVLRAAVDRIVDGGQPEIPEPR